MAVSVSFFLAYTASYIKEHRLQASPVTVRCELRYTMDGLPWALSRRVDGQEKRYKFNLPHKVEPRNWHTGRAKHTDPSARQINTLIDHIAARARELHAQYLHERAFPSPETFVVEILGRPIVAERQDFFGDYDTYIDFLENRKSSRVFITAHRLIAATLKKFEQSTGYGIEYARINKTFAAKFIAWCEANLPRRRPDQDLNRTARKYLDDLKIFLSHALSEGWTRETGFKQIKITFLADPFPLTHTEQEIEALLTVTAADLAGMTPDKRERALISRDWYVLATQTSMRYVDWKSRRMTILKVDSGWNIRFIQHKTDGALEIPVSRVALRILEMHNFELPAGFSPSATLIHVRAVARAAGINKKIGTHTARRTFCTLREKDGVPRSVIMRITGHRTEKDYLRYVGVTYEQNADLMRRANPKMYDLKKEA